MGVGQLRPATQPDPLSLRQRPGQGTAACFLRCQATSEPIWGQTDGSASDSNQKMDAVHHLHGLHRSTTTWGIAAIKIRLYRQ